MTEREAMCSHCGEEPATIGDVCRDCDIDLVLERMTCPECRHVIYRPQFRQGGNGAHADTCSRRDDPRWWEPRP